MSLGKCFVELNYGTNLVEAKEQKRPSNQSHSALIQHITIQSNAKPLNGQF